MNRRVCVLTMILAVSFVTASCFIDISRDNPFDPKGENFNGLLGAWTFEEGTGTVADDLSVNNYTGTIDMAGNGWDYNNVYPDAFSHGHSLYFHDSDGNATRKVTIGDIEAFDFAAADATITIEAIVNIYYSGQIISKYNGTNGWYFRVWGAYPFELAFFASGSSGHTLELSMPTGVLENSQWYHVACTIDIKNKNYKFYVNGVSQTVTIDNDTFAPGETIALTNANVLIGASEAAGGEIGNNSYIDEVLIYNTILSPGTVADHADGNY